MFELRRLRLLHELALRGTLAAVAEALAYSPSTISQQLAQLEREAGVPLLVPDGRRVRLTEHGAALAAHAARALDADERIRAELEELQPGIAPVRVAVLQTAARTIVPAALTLLAERAPGLRVELAEVPPEEGLFELSARGFDLAIAEQYPGLTRAHHPGLDRQVLGTDPLRLATADAPSRLHDLAATPWVMEPAGTAAREWAVQQCRAAGFEPDVRFEFADLGAHVSLIASGHAVGLLPDLLWTGGRPPVTLSALPGDPVREIFTASRLASAGRPGIRLVRDAIAEAFAG
ncbi:MAG: LysR family transcriptional regulator [Microbacterium sp. SCN 70-27]|uniref:LysR family transcriptional regulator n=1 Tax=unclassified Microbacterium TaxID=2609290 RepID=UPI000868A26E|nr:MULTISPECIES: LysR family transcriptional regulator [unclassified Microbacterium]MBN9224319.1 LysR family transcriptional regulator [Microbacterium sp.]ODT28796.1 MAG: LysR family transcriptional regulator [Microbacterium sp. SCN 70-27]